MNRPTAVSFLWLLFLSAFAAEQDTIELEKFNSPLASPDEIATRIVKKPIYPISVHAVAFSPNSRTLASGDGTGQVRLWEVNTGKLIRDFRAHSNWVFTIKWTHDGSSIITGGGDNLIHWFDTANPGVPARTIHAHSNDVHAIALTRDGKTLYSAGDDRQVVFWDLKRDALKQRFIAHDRQIPTIVLSPNEKLLASGSRDHSIRIWDANDGALRQTLLGHTSDVMALSFAPKGSFLASAGWDSTVQIWDLDQGKAVRVLQISTNLVSGVAFSPNGKRLVASSGPELRLFEVADGKLLWRSEFNSVIRANGMDTTEDLSSVIFSPNGKFIAVGSTTGSVYLVSPESGKVIRKFTWLSSLPATSESDGKH